MYATSVPVFSQMLNSLSDILHKTEAHAAAKNIEPSVFLQARLSPDMFPLLRQVQIAADFARGVSARLAGQDVPKVEDNHQSFADCQALIKQSLDFIHSINAELFEGQESREIITRPGTPKERRFNGQAYLLHYGLPQFFFHVATAYAILRQHGVELGKKDYMGSY